MFPYNVGSSRPEKVRNLELTVFVFLRLVSAHKCLDDIQGIRPRKCRNFHSAHISEQWKQATALSMTRERDITELIIASAGRHRGSTSRIPTAVTCPCPSWQINSPLFFLRNLCQTGTVSDSGGGPDPHGVNEYVRLCQSMGDHEKMRLNTGGSQNFRAKQKLQALRRR